MGGRLQADEEGRVYYGRVRLPFYVVNGAFRFRVKQPHLRRFYGDLIIVKLEDLVELLRQVDEHRQM